MYDESTRRFEEVRKYNIPMQSKGSKVGWLYGTYYQLTATLHSNYRFTVPFTFLIFIIDYSVRGLTKPLI